MSAITKRTSVIGTILFMTAMLFTGNLFAQSNAVWSVATFAVDPPTYDDFAPFCETGSPCTELPGLELCIDGFVTCATTAGSPEPKATFSGLSFGLHTVCLSGAAWKVGHATAGSTAQPLYCVQKDFTGLENDPSHTTAMYLEPNTVFTVTKEFSDDGAGSATVGVTCTNGATATAQGDGTLDNDESQDWVITNITIDTRCTAREQPIPAGYTGSADNGPQGSCDSAVLTEGDQGACTITNTLNTATIRVDKDYTDGSTAPVDVTMTCQSGNVDGTGNPYNTKPVAGGGFVSFTVTGFNQTTDASGQSTRCQITESNLPPNYSQVSALGDCNRIVTNGAVGTCTLTNGPNRATFIIEKQWDQLGDTDGIPVTGHLSCTGANQTQQNVVFTATTDAILFVYDINLAGGPVDCTVTEDVPANYRANYECNDDNCGDSDTQVAACFYPNVEFFGVYRCTITNRPLPAHVTVTKTWVIEGGDQGFDGGHYVVGVCDSRIDGPTSDEACVFGGSLCFAASWQDTASEGSIDYEFTILKPRYPFTQCEFFEDLDDNVVESDNGCGRMRLGAGADVDCEIVNTVFFEGIPTLNQYGMAILALLMLGVGFVGFRRFV